MLAQLIVLCFKAYYIRGFLLLCHLTKTVSFTINSAVLMYFQALVYEHPGQELEIELFDEDPDKDDFLGR